MINRQFLQTYYSRANWTHEAAEYVKCHSLNVSTFEVPAVTLAIIPCRHENGFFQFGSGGVPSVVIEVTYRAQPVDLVAWTVDGPEQISLMTGAADGLGCDQVEAPWSWFDRESFPVHRTPLCWLKAGCIGVCILNHHTAPVWLSKAIGRLEAEDRQHAVELHGLLNISFPRSRIRFSISIGGKEDAA